MLRNSCDLIKEGHIVEVDFDYLTDDGRIISRVYVGRRGTTLKWKVEGNDFCFRNLWDAYFGHENK
jgi:hypothetical protein